MHCTNSFYILNSDEVIFEEEKLNAHLRIFQYSKISIHQESEEKRKKEILKENKHRVLRV